MSADFYYEGTDGPDSQFGTYELMDGEFGDDVLGSDYLFPTIFGADGNDIVGAYYPAGGKAVLYGNGGDDLVFGSTGNDKLYGGLGSDFILGGSGKNVFWGGSGRDQFGFAELPDDQLDKIKDFKVKNDFLNFVPSVFTVGIAGETLSKSQFRYGKAAKDDDDNFGYNKKTGIVWFDPDGIGGQAQVDIVKVGKNLAFTHQNIQL